MMMLVALGCTLISAVTDLRNGLIYDRVTASAAAVLAILAATGHELPRALLGASIAGGVLLVLHVVTRRRGIGLGDVKLAGVVGAGFGAQLGITAIGLAFVAGAVVAVALLAARRAHRSDRIPFAPFIAFGACVALLLGEAPDA
jgi:prepilin signal peptidase PulO-like enzyme (type II secretory pathway)